MNTVFDTKDSGRREENNQTGMVRDVREGKGRFDLIPPLALRRLAGVYERGAVKYEARNWEKGGSFSRFIDSAERHVNDYKLGKRDEDHLAQAVWNLFSIIHFEELGRVDLDDLPRYLSNDGSRPITPAAPAVTREPAPEPSAPEAVPVVHSSSESGRPPRAAA